MISVGSFARNMKNSSNGPAREWTLQGTLTVSAVILCAVAFIGITLRLTNLFAFPRVRKGKTPRVLLGDRGFCIGDAAICWQQAFRFIDIEFHDAKATGEPATIYILGAWGFGAARIEVPVPSACIDDAKAIVAQAKGQAATSAKAA